MELLEKSFARFSRRAEADPAAAASFDAFCEAERAWLVDYAFFRALMEENGASEKWNEWREEHRDRGFGAGMASRAIRRKAGAIQRTHEIFPIRPMGRIRPMERR